MFVSNTGKLRVGTHIIDSKTYCTIPFYTRVVVPNKNRCVSIFQLKNNYGRYIASLFKQQKTLKSIQMTYNTYIQFLGKLPLQKSGNGSRQNSQVVRKTRNTNLAVSKKIKMQSEINAKVGLLLPDNILLISCHCQMVYRFIYMLSSVTFFVL